MVRWFDQQVTPSLTAPPSSPLHIPRTGWKKVIRKSGCCKKRRNQTRAYRHMFRSVSDFQIPQVLVIFPGRDFNEQQGEDGMMQTRGTTCPMEPGLHLKAFLLLNPTQIFAFTFRWTVRPCITPGGIWFPCPDGWWLHLVHGEHWCGVGAAVVSAASWTSSRNMMEQRDLTPVNVEDCFLCLEKGQDGSQRECGLWASLVLHGGHCLKPGSIPKTHFCSLFLVASSFNLYFSSNLMWKCTSHFSVSHFPLDLMYLFRILPLGACCYLSPSQRCCFLGAPLHLQRWQLSFPRQLSRFSAFHKHTFLYFCSAVTNRGQLQNTVQKLLHLTEDGGICVCCRAGPDFKPTAENDRQALSAGFTLMGNSGLLPKLAMLDVAKKDLGGPFEGTVIHVFRSQWRIKGGNSKKEAQTLPLSGTYYLFFFFFLFWCLFFVCLFSSGTVLEWTWEAEQMELELRWAPTHQPLSTQQLQRKHVEQAFLHILLTHPTANTRQTPIITATLQTR